MRDEIATGEALPDDGVDVTALVGSASTETLIRAVSQFATACNAVPHDGPVHVGILSRCTMAKIGLRRSLDAFCDARGIERI